MNSVKRPKTGDNLKMAPSKKLWNEKAETMPRPELRELQLKKLKAQVKYNYEHSEFYRQKFESAGCLPGDIKSFGDFEKIPLMTKEEHRQAQEESMERFGNPYSLIACAPKDKIVRINATSGTTGTPTLYALTKHDIATVNEMHARKYWRCGIRPEHIMLQALSLSMFTGGLPLSEGIMTLGAAVVPVGVDGGTKRVLDFIQLTSPDAIIATPSFGEYLIEKTPEITGRDAKSLGLRWFFCAGEPGGGNPEIRKRLSEGFGAKVFDHTGGGHAFHGMECEEPPSQYSGMHFVSEDYCLLELVDPASKSPIPLAEGAVGEMVFTFLDWEGTPLMRYALGDMLEVHTDPCACGMPGIRFKIIGRADDMLIIKGVNVYPNAIKNAVQHFYPRVTGAMKIILEKQGPQVTPPLKIQLESGAELEKDLLPALEEEMLHYFRQSLRIAPDFLWVAPGTIPRTTQKSKLVVIEKPEKGGEF